MKITPIRLNTFNSAAQSNSTPQKTQSNQNNLKSDFSFTSNCIANINMAGINFKSNKPDMDIKGHVRKIYAYEHAKKSNEQNAILVAKSVIDKFEKAKENGLQADWREVETEDGTWLSTNSLDYEKTKRLRHTFIDGNNKKWDIFVEYNTDGNYIYDVDVKKYDAKTGKLIKQMSAKCENLKPAEQDEFDAKADELEEAINKADKNYTHLRDEREVTEECAELNRALRNKEALEKHKARLNGCFEKVFTDSDGGKWVAEREYVFEDRGKEWSIYASITSDNHPQYIDLTCRDLATDEVEQYNIDLFDDWGYALYSGYDEYEREDYHQVDIDMSEAVSQTVIDKQKELEERFFDRRYYPNKEKVITKLANLERYMDKIEDMIKNIQEYESDSDYYTADKNYLKQEFNKAYAEYKDYDERMQRKEFSQENIRAREIYEMNEEKRMREEEEFRKERRYYASSPELWEEYQRELRKAELDFIRWWS